MALERILFRPGAVAAGANIALPAGAKPIDAVVSAALIRTGDHSHTENLASAYTQNATTATASVTLSSVAATPTKVNETTITLDVATAATDLLELTYMPVGGRIKVA